MPSKLVLMPQSCYNSLMSSPDQDPHSASATAAELGNVFRVAMPWLIENGTIDPTDDLGDTRYHDVDGDVIYDLLPQAAAALGITVIDTLECAFFPSYTNKDSVQPPEISLAIKRNNPNIVAILGARSVVDSVTFDLTLLPAETDDWLATGKKETEYISLEQQEIDFTEDDAAFLLALGERMFANKEVRERIRENNALENLLPNDPISPDECAALQAIVDNFDALKREQESRDDEF